MIRLPHIAFPMFFLLAAFTMAAWLTPLGPPLPIRQYDPVYKSRVILLSTNGFHAKPITGIIQTTLEIDPPLIVPLNTWSTNVLMRGATPGMSASYFAPKLEKVLRVQVVCVEKDTIQIELFNIESVAVDCNKLSILLVGESE